MGEKTDFTKALDCYRAVGGRFDVLEGPTKLRTATVRNSRWSCTGQWNSCGRSLMSPPND